MNRAIAPYCDRASTGGGRGEGAKGATRVPPPGGRFRGTLDARRYYLMAAGPEPGPGRPLNKVDRAIVFTLRPDMQISTVQRLLRQGDTLAPETMERTTD